MWSRPPERLQDVWTAYRHTSPGYRPMWYGAGAATLRQGSGRWHEQGRGVAQYLALTADGAWAERCRYEHIRDDERRREDSRCLWQLQIVEHDIADLSTFDAWVTCGLSPELSVGPHPQVWPLADRLRAQGYRGVLAPSAAHDVPGAANLVLFDQRLERSIIGPMPDPSDNPNPDLFTQAILLVDDGRPTASAMQRTCYLDEHHFTFRDWCKKSGYTLGAPATTKHRGK